MMVNCPICGKLTCIHWPEHWVYRRGPTYYCSYTCMDVSISRDFNELKKVTHKRRKELINMARVKKDGTPAKKPGPKTKKPTVTMMEEPGAPGFTEEDVQAIKDAVPTVQVDGPLRIETDYSEQIEIVEPQNPTRVIRRMFGFEVSAIRDDVMGEFYYDIKFNRIDWRSPDGTEVSLSPTAWKSFSEKIPAVLNALGVKL